MEISGSERSDDWVVVEGVVPDDPFVTALLFDLTLNGRYEHFQDGTVVSKMDVSPELLLWEPLGYFGLADVDCFDAETQGRSIADEGTEATASVVGKAQAVLKSKSKPPRREPARNCRTKPKGDNTSNRPKKYKTGRKVKLWREQAEKITSILMAKDKAAATYLWKQLYAPVKRKPYERARHALKAKEKKGAMKCRHKCNSCGEPRQHHTCIFFKFDANRWAYIKKLLAYSPEVCKAETRDKSAGSPPEGSPQVETLEVPSPSVPGPASTDGDGAANGASNEGEAWANNQVVAV